MIGQLLGGKYKVVRLIGEGGMGAVYEGEQPLGTTKRRVAVKTLHPHLSRDPKIKARFEREVGTVAELEHPNTIQVHDFGVTPEGILYIVMEFLQGKSLASELEKQGAMAPERVMNVLQQVCGSLEEAHGRGIVHRDLKPDNVVLVERAGKKDFVKVLDFGIAKRSREEDSEEQKLTQQGMVLGTPPYMSPEQFTGRPIDSRSDIYSLAVMTYEMLSGRLPFKADTAWEWATQHMTQPPIPIESIPEGARATESMRGALRRALAKNPDERFQTVRDFVDAFCAASNSTAAGPVAAQRTEVGTPLEVGGAFAPAAGAPMGGSIPGAPPHGYTPAAGNVAFPTPAAIPQAPPRESGGGGRKGLLAVAGVIAVASVLAIAFAMKGGSRNKEVVFDNSTSGEVPAPATSLAPTPEVLTAPAASDSSSGADVPPLKNGPTTAPATAAHPVPHPSASAATQTSASAAPQPSAHEPAREPPREPTAEPSPVPHTIASAFPNALPNAFPNLAPTSQPARYDGPECQRARTLRAMGRHREAQSFLLTCIAKGGQP